MNKILIFGGSGLVGSKFIELNSGEFEIISPSIDDVDILEPDQVKDVVSRFSGDIVLNLAAFTNVDGAEEEKDNKDGLTYKLNAKAPSDIAKSCKENNKYLVHISTDYVFDGKKEESPYEETDEPNPINWYGQTKFLGEEFVKEAGCKFAIIRLSMPFSAHYSEKSDIARTFLKMLKDGNEIKAVADQKITPILVDDIARGLNKLINARSEGIYHLVGSSWTTPYKFAKRISEIFSLNQDLVKEINFYEYSEKAKARRLKNSWLSNRKFTKEFGENLLHDVETALNIFKEQTDD